MIWWILWGYHFDHHRLPDLYCHSASIMKSPILVIYNTVASGYKNPVYKNILSIRLLGPVPTDFVGKTRINFLVRYSCRTANFCVEILIKSSNVYYFVNIVRVKTLQHWHDTIYDNPCPRHFNNNGKKTAAAVVWYWKERDLQVRCWVLPKMWNKARVAGNQVLVWRTTSRTSMLDSDVQWKI